VPVDAIRLDAPHHGEGSHKSTFAQQPGIRFQLGAFLDGARVLSIYDTGRSGLRLRVQP
jgi:hypothetical protein